MDKLKKRKCVICNKKTRLSKESSGNLDEQISVIYFWKTFLPSHHKTGLELKDLLIK